MTVKSAGGTRLIKWRKTTSAQHLMVMMTGEVGLILSCGLVIADNTGLLNPMYEGLDKWLGE